MFYFLQTANPLTFLQVMTGKESACIIDNDKRLLWMNLWAFVVDPCCKWYDLKNVVTRTAYLVTFSVLENEKETLILDFTFQKTRNGLGLM
jgi:hypothetical protein